MTAVTPYHIITTEVITAALTVLTLPLSGQMMDNTLSSFISITLIFKSLQTSAAVAS